MATEITMTNQQRKTRCNAWAAWLTVLGLAPAAPALAVQDYTGDAYVVVKQTRGKATSPDQRDTVKGDSRDDRRASGRKDDRDEPDAYGYGYERRQQQRNENDGRPRGRH